MKKKLISILSVVLIFAVCIAPTVSAATYASDYFVSFSSNIQSGGSGKVLVSIKATGKVGVNEIGAEKIVLEESKDGNTWRKVETFTSDEYPEMMKYGVRSIGSSVTYNGTSGCYYRATLTFYAGTDGVGETRTGYAPSAKVS
mgnify:CR=1 FL=1